MMKRTVDMYRRRMLVGAGGVVIGLPLLETFMPRRARAQTGKAIYTMFMQQQNGVIQGTAGDPQLFWPAAMGPITAANMTGVDMDKATSELKDYADKLLMIRGINFPFGNPVGCGHSSGCNQTITAAKMTGPDQPIPAGQRVGRHAHRPPGADGQGAAHPVRRPQGGLPGRRLLLRRRRLGAFRGEQPAERLQPAVRGHAPGPHAPRRDAARARRRRGGDAEAGPAAQVGERPAALADPGADGPQGAEQERQGSPERSLPEHSRPGGGHGQRARAAAQRRRPAGPPDGHQRHPHRQRQDGGRGASCTWR